MPATSMIRAAPADAESNEQTFARTLDLRALAGIAEDEKVRVQGVGHRTLDLFDRTLDLLKQEQPPTPEHASGTSTYRFVPQHADLRARFKFAEVLGSYATLNTLLDRFAPIYALTHTRIESECIANLSAADLQLLSDYRTQIEIALDHASAHVATTSIAQFSEAELHELNEILNEARNRYRTLDRLLGMRLIHDVEQSVQQLYRLCEKIAMVQRSITGIFLIESEIMFVPSADLVRMINDIFKAIGNPFVVENVDGTILLAARNLLIQVMSFYAYYGREQIYQVFGRDQGKAGRAKIAGYIKDEIRTLFSACKVNNKLILTRVMDHAEREFEISVEAIQNEAANRAIAEVERLLPQKPQMPAASTRPGLFSRLASWLFRS